MPIEATPRQKKRDLSGAATSITKAILSALPSLVIGDPTSITKSAGSSISNLIDTIISINKDKSDQLDYDAWDLIRAAFAVGLTNFLSKVALTNKLEGKELSNFIDLIVNRNDCILLREPNHFSLDSLFQPLLMPALRDAAKCIPLDLKPYGPLTTPIAIRKEFESHLFEGLRTVRTTKPNLFRKIEDSLSNPFEAAIEKRNAQASHQAFIVRGFTQAPIFGQEQTGVTVSDLYLQQRCLWYTKEYKSKTAPTKGDELTLALEDAHESDYSNKYVKKLYVGEIHAEFDQWLLNRSAEDFVRVVAGGPGSGKSTFAKSLAISVMDSQTYDVLYIPLQEIPSTGSFEQRIEELFHNRTELGFDRVDSPLKWLGKTRPDGSPPQKPLLLICDGLDEISSPESKEAANTTTDFIQSLSTWVYARNSHGCYVKCVVLGRDVAAEEAFKKLHINPEKLLYIGGLLPLTERADWVKYNKSNDLIDTKSISKIDQRVEYWEKWAKYFSLDKTQLPEALKEEAQSETALQELTSEPLLLYLLLWTGYLGEKWREAAKNRNVVYREIFDRIYRRDWGDSGRKYLNENRSMGGHTSTTELSIEEFLSLQESLGLAAWPNGGRVLSKNSFNKVIKLYVSEELYHEYKVNDKISLKSIALHSYTRGAESDDSGYEFVHKSLGEYLIGRSLAVTIIRASENIKDRVIDEHCKRGSYIITKIYSLGILTPEIARFLKDELLLRFKSEKLAQKTLHSRLIPLTNWILNNMLPVDVAIPAEQSDRFADKLSILIRSLDVYWFSLQTLAEIVFPSEAFENESHPLNWQSGPIQLSWPSSVAFSSLFAKLADREHINEAGRISTFNRLYFKNQLLTDLSFGAVIYDKSEVAPKPNNWFGLEAQGSKFENAAFYRSNLQQADFSMSSFEACSFHQTNMQATIGSLSKFMGCRFTNTDFTTSVIDRAEFNDCKFSGVQFVYTTLVESRFHHCRIEDAEINYRGINRYIKSDIISSSFKSVEFVNLVVSKTVFKQTDFGASTFINSSLNSSSMRNCVFTSAKLVNTKVNKQQLKEFGLHNEMNDLFDEDVGYAVIDHQM